MTPEEWISHWTGKTYVEMTPREIIESNIRSDLSRIKTILDFPSMRSQKELVYELNGLYAMLIRWQYILHMLDAGERSSEKL